MSADKPELLPTAVRYATLAAIALGAIVSFSAARELPLVLMSPTLETPELDLGPFKALVPDPAIVKEASQAAFRAQLSAIESMRVSRSIILIALATSAALVFVAALRVRWPGGVSRRAVSRLLAISAVASALLRTADGAQLLVIMRKGVAALDKVIARSAATELQLPPDLNLVIYSTVSIGLTLLVVGLFLGLGSYFRSARVQDAFAALDRDVE